MYLTNNKPGLSNLFVLVFWIFRLFWKHILITTVFLWLEELLGPSLSLSLSLCAVHWSPAPKDDLEWSSALSYTNSLMQLLCVWTASSSHHEPTQILVIVQFLDDDDDADDGQLAHVHSLVSWRNLGFY